MKVCKQCGLILLDDTTICPVCNAKQDESNTQSNTISKQGMCKNTNNLNHVLVEYPGLAILAVVFGLLGGWFGLLFGIIGLRSYKYPTDPYHKQNVAFCKMGIALFIVEVIIEIIILFCNLTKFYYYFC